jgi:hypothetical protein
MINKFKKTPTSSKLSLSNKTPKLLLPNNKQLLKSKPSQIKLNRKLLPSNKPKLISRWWSKKKLPDPSPRE